MHEHASNESNKNLTADVVELGWWWEAQIKKLYHCVAVLFHLQRWISCKENLIFRSNNDEYGILPNTLLESNTVKLSVTQISSEMVGFLSEGWTPGVY